MPDARVGTGVAVFVGDHEGVGVGDGSGRGVCDAVCEGHSDVAAVQEGDGVKVNVGVGDSATPTRSRSADVLGRSSASPEERMNGAAARPRRKANAREKQGAVLSIISAASSDSLAAVRQASLIFKDELDPERTGRG